MKKLDEQVAKIARITAINILLTFLTLAITNWFYPEKLLYVASFFLVALSFSCGWIIGLLNADRIVGETTQNEEG